MSVKSKRRPTHPGAILREDVLPELGVTMADFAHALGISSRTVSDLLKERSRLTVDVAERIGLALNMAPEIWLRLQQAVDLYDLRLKNRTSYKQIQRIAA